MDKFWASKIVIAMVASVLVAQVSSSHIRAGEDQCALAKNQPVPRIQQVDTEDGKLQITYRGSFMFFDVLDRANEWSGYLQPTLLAGKLVSNSSQFAHLSLEFDCATVDVLVLKAGNKAQIVANFTRPMFDGQRECSTKDVALKPSRDSLPEPLSESCRPQKPSNVTCLLSMDILSLDSLQQLN